MAPREWSRWILGAAGYATAYVAIGLALAEFLRREHAITAAVQSPVTIAFVAVLWFALLGYRLWRERPT